MEYCKNCPIQNENRPKVEFVGNCENSIYIIGQSPGKKEAQTGKPFVGHSGTILNTLLYQAGIDRNKTRIANIVKCFYEAGATIDRKVITCCANHVLEDVKQFNPKVVITLGENAFYGLTKKNDFRAYRFVPIPYPEHNYWLIPLYHPRFLSESRDKGLRSLTLRVLKHAKFLSTTDYIPKCDDYKIEILTSSNKVINAIDSFNNNKFVAFDFETTTLHPHYDNSYIATCALSDGERTVVFPLENYFNRQKEFEIKETLVKLFRNENVTKLAFNLAFENYWLLSRFNFSFKEINNYRDVMILSYIFYPRNGLFGLKPLVRVWLGADENYAIDVKDVYKMLTENPESIYELMEYNAKDAYYTARIYQAIRDRYNKLRFDYYAVGNNSDFESVYGLSEDEVYCILRLGEYYSKNLKQLPISISESQFKGACANIEFLDRLEVELKEQLKKELKKIYSDERIPETTKQILSVLPDKENSLLRILGFEKEQTKEEKKLKKEIFDIRSSRQLSKFFLDCGYDLPKTKKGNVSVNETVLHQLAEKDKLAKHILNVRAIDKKLSAYVYGLREWIFDDGRFHPSYRAVSEGTTRPLANKINIQQFPKRKGKEMRKILKAPEGYVLLDFDYSALEVRVLAMLSKDRRLIEYIENGIDFHLEWSKRIFGESKAQEMRNLVKNQFVFPLFYGAGLKTVCNGLGISESKAESLIEQFWSEFTGVKLWQEKQWNLYQRNGFVSNYFGRRRYAPVGWNEIINYPIQSTAVEFTIYAWNKLTHLGYWIVAEVHDELVVCVEDDERIISKAIRDIYNAMVKQPWKILRIVPLAIEGKIGYNWAEMQEIELEKYVDISG